MFGNRTQQTPGATLYSYPGGNNRIAGYTYDASGNVLDDGGTQYGYRYGYDGEGRLCTVYNKALGLYTGYAYDGMGNRVAKGTGMTSLSCDNSFTPTSSFVAGANGQQLDELNATGLNYSNVFANGQLLATYTFLGANWTYALNNWQGTKRFMANGDGRMAETCTGFPYGDNQFCSGPGGDPSPQHFTGKERDTESGLDNFEARYFSSNMGRFLSPDFNGDDDYSSPVPYADLSNPQTLNLYGYAGNNPLTNVDPDGHDCIYFSGSGDASVKSGDCFSDTDNGIYVNGTINSLSYNSANSGLGFSYTAYDTGNIGTGVIAGAPAPGSGPEMDEGGATDQSGGLLGTIAGVSGAYQAIRTLTSALGAARSAPGRTPPDVNNLSPKIVRQMGTRGWTKDEISETVRNGVPHDVTNKATGGPAVEYVNPANGKFVVIDKTTNQVLQVSGPGFSPNHLMNP